MNVAMVVIGGLLMLGGLFIWWIPFIGFFGIVGGLLGFILFIVGLVIPSERREERIILHPSSPQPTLAICPQCGNRIPSDSNFCPKCGADVRPKQI